MTDEVGATQDKPDEAEIVRNAKAAIFPFDPSLESLVMYINLLDTTEVGITLHVRGTVISGLLISPRSFYRLLVGRLEKIAEGGEEPTKSGAMGFADFFRMSLEAQERLRNEYRTNDTLPPRPHHIHLREASVFVGSGEPLVHPTWRGRLTEVDGWSFGNFGGPIPPLPDEE